MRKILIFLLALASMSTLGCDAAATDSQAPASHSRPAPAVSEAPPADLAAGKEKEDEEMKEIQISLGGEIMTLELADNATAREFARLLPLEMDLRELNGNEKYGDLPRSLPSNSTRPGTIQAGDVMLYGDDCLVVFYKTFSSSYAYTRIGRIKNFKEGAGWQAESRVHAALVAK